MSTGGWLHCFIQRHGLWKGLVWCLAQLLVWFGAVYTIQADRAFSGPSLATLRDILPGGLRTFGVVMVLVGTMVLSAASVGGRYAHRALFATFVVFLVLLGFSISGGLQTRIFPIGAGLWIFGAIAALWLSVHTPARQQAVGGRDVP